MAKSLNLCQFIGHIGKDVDISYMPNGKAVAKFSIACADDYKDQQGKKVERTNWINVVAFDKVAEIIGEFCRKGSKIYVSGKQVTRKWQAQDGTDRYSTEIVATDMQMLDSKPQSGDGQQAQPAQPTQRNAQYAQGPAPGAEEFDEIPF